MAALPLKKEKIFQLLGAYKKCSKGKLILESRAVMWIYVKNNIQLLLQFACFIALAFIMVGRFLENLK